jgi:hypothetical protein
MEVQRDSSHWNHWLHSSRLVTRIDLSNFITHEYTYAANGMSEALSVAVYFLLCRELGLPAHFPGNEFLWEGVDDKSYAPSIADLAVFASTHDHCSNQIFNHTNGDVIVWKNFWPKIAQYYGLKVQKPNFA